MHRSIRFAISFCSLAAFVACGTPAEGTDPDAGTVGGGGDMPPVDGSTSPTPDGGEEVSHTLRVVLAGDGTGLVQSMDESIYCDEDGVMCEIPVPAGTEMTLTATPEAPARFAGWSGAGVDCMGEAVCTVTVDEDIEVTATFTVTEVALLVSTGGTGTGIVVSEPRGIDCGDTCSATYAEGRTVRLTAMPDESSDFVGWSGACTGTELDCVLRLDDDAEVMATFELRTYPVEVTLAGDGLGTVTSDPTGVDCGDTCTSDFGHGSTVTLEATAAPGSTFTGWTGCDAATGTSCEVTVTEARAVEATFERNRFSLMVSNTGAGAGTVTSDPMGIDCGADCMEVYEEGAVVSLTAAPDTSSRFVEWGGACTGSDATCVVTLSEARTVTARFELRSWTLDVTTAGTGAGRVTADVGSIDCGSDCNDDYPHGAMVELTAAADGTSTFAGWAGACSGTATTCRVTMTEARSVTATFALGERELSISTIGTGGGRITSMPAGIDCGTDCSEDFDHGEVVTLTATADPDSVFTGWSGACTGTAPTCTITTTSPNAVSATFALRTYRLDVSRMGTGTGSVESTPSGISCGTDCTEELDHGTSVTLRAIPSAPDSEFLGWSGDCSGTRTCTVSMTGARNVTATFGLVPRDLTVRIAGSGMGTVTSDPMGVSCGMDCEETYPHGTLVTLTAAEDMASSSFAGWMGACTGVSRTCTVSMTEAREAIATFELVPRDLTVTTAGAGTGVVTSMPIGIDCGADCAEAYPHGEVVTLTATPMSGTSQLAGWAGDCTGTAPTCVLTMDADRMATATFEPIPRDLSVSVTGMGRVDSSMGGIACGADCDETYPHGQMVTLEATAATGWAFDAWGGACAGEASTTCTVTMNAARNVTATFVITQRTLTVSPPTGDGTVTSAPSGIDCGADCAQDYDYGTDVTLTASPDTGWVFDAWGGACAGEPTDTCTVSMTAARTVSVTFTITQRRLTVSAPTGSGAGRVTSAPTGIDCGSDCTEDYDYGTSVTLTANPDAGSVFGSWGGACSGEATDTCTVSMTDARSVSVTFDITQRRLRVDTPTGDGDVTSAPGGIACAGDCTEDYDYGTSVTLTANPDPGWVVDSWGGDCTSATGDTCVLSMTSDRRVSVTFRITQRRLTVSAPTGSGTVTSAPTGIDCGSDCTQDYDYGTSVTLTANPATGWVVGSWGGACAGASGATCVVSMTAARTVSVTFTITQRQLRVDSPTGSGTVSSAPSGINCGADCTQDYDYGTSVTLTATPAPGWEVASWGRDCSSATGTTCVLSMTANRRAAVTFRITQRELRVATPTGSGTVTSAPGGIDCAGDCTQSYDYGTSVTLTANPATGWEVASWGGDCSGSGTTCTLPMTSDRNVSITFRITQRRLRVTSVTGSGGVTSAPGGIACGSDCSEDYDYGTDVTLTAAPDTGWEVASWGGACSGSGTTCRLPMTAARDVTITFARIRHRLRVTSVTGSGSVASVPAGISCGSDCQQDYDYGTSVTLTATPDMGHAFVRWGGACASEMTASCTVPMTAARDVSVTFQITSHRLVVRTGGAGAGRVASDPPGIDCGSDCMDTYDWDTTVTLEAMPDPTTSVFGGWTGDCDSVSGTTCTVNVRGARNVAATFDLAPRPLDVTVVGNGRVDAAGGGIACGSDCDEVYLHGAMVELTAMPGSRTIEFRGWSGGGCGGMGATCMVTMDRARSVTATFGPIQRTLSITRTGSGNVTVTPSGTSCGPDCYEFDTGTDVTLEAVEATGWDFSSWGGACAGVTTMICNRRISSDQTVSVTFVRESHPVAVRRVGTGAGMVQSTDGRIVCGRTCRANYLYGDVVELRAMAGPGSRFVRWRGETCQEGTQTGLTCTVRVAGPVSLDAEFAEGSGDNPVLTVENDNTRGGSVTSDPFGISCGGDCSESYPRGTLVRLEAREEGSFGFVGWGGDAARCGREPICEIRMDGDRTVSATFR